MTPFSAPLAPSSAPRPSYCSLGESSSLLAPLHTPQQGGGGTTRHDSPGRECALPGRMVSPIPASAPFHSWPGALQLLLAAYLCRDRYYDVAAESSMYTQYSTHEPERETDGWGTRDRFVLPPHFSNFCAPTSGLDNLQPRFSRLLHMFPICSRYL